MGLFQPVSEIGQRDANGGALALHMDFFIIRQALRARAANQFTRKEPPSFPSVTLARIPSRGTFGVEIGSTGKRGRRAPFCSGRRRTRDWQQQCLSLSLHMYVSMGSHNAECVRECARCVHACRQAAGRPPFSSSRGKRGGERGARQGTRGPKNNQTNDKRSK